MAQDPHQVVQRNDIQTRKEPHGKTEKRASTTTSTCTGQLSPQLQRSVELSQEKGSSAWLTALPVAEHGFLLHKGLSLGMGGTGAAAA